MFIQSFKITVDSSENAFLFALSRHANENSRQEYGMNIEVYVTVESVGLSAQHGSHHLRGRTPRWPHPDAEPQRALASALEGSLALLRIL